MTPQSESVQLSIELVPQPMWGKNVRKIVSQETWQSLRQEFNLDHGRCNICKRKEREETLQLHEVWHYEDDTKMQRLVALVPLCQFCHEVKHIGRTMKVGDGERAIEHLRKTNGWGENEALRHVDRALTQWRERSQHRWTLDVSMLTEFVPETMIHEQWLSRPAIRPSNPLEARLWAAETLGTGALIIDTETTGLPKKHSRCEIIEVSILSMDGEIVFDSLIKPKYRIPKRTIEINGITNEDVADAPCFPDVFDEIAGIIEGAHLIAYKSEFDREMFAKTCGMYKLELPDCDWDCAMWAYYFYLGSRTKRLSSLPGARHHALGDCRAILDLMHEMARGEGEYYGRYDFSIFTKT